jgi:hypothetical protein
MAQGRSYATIETGLDATDWTLYTAIATSGGLRCIPCGYNTRQDALRAFRSVADSGAWARIVEHADADDRVGNVIAEAGTLPGDHPAWTAARSRYYRAKGAEARANHLADKGGAV